MPTTDMISFADASKHPEYGRIPDYILKGIYSYVGHRIQVGGFLLAVFRNDLLDAVGRADKEALAALKEIVIFVHMEVPSACHGSPAAVNNWLNPQTENPLDRFKFVDEKHP